MSHKFEHQLTYTKFPQSLYHGDKIKLVNAHLTSYGAGQRILDIGCGAVPYNAPGNEVVGMDADPAIVERLQQAGRAQIHLGDANKTIPFGDGTFDTVLLLDVIEHFYNPPQAVSEIRRVLKPN